MVKNAIVWFRNDLRTKDNEVLARAISENDSVVGVYFFDPRNFEKNKYGFKKTEKYRAQFLIETVQDLKVQLKELHIPLYIFSQYPEDVFLQFLKNLEVTSIYLQQEWTQDEKRVTNAVKTTLKNYHINWTEILDQFLYHPDDVPFETENVPKIFTDFRKKCEKNGTIRDLTILRSMPRENWKEINHTIPTLQDLGFANYTIPEKAAFKFIGGSNAAEKRIQNYFWETENLKTYKETRNGLVGEAYSSKLSAWLANGSISPRTIYHQIKKFEREVVSNNSTYWLIFELIWRDYFKYISLKYGDQIFQLGGILNKAYDWKVEQKEIESWIMGTTEEPFVNANMLELRYSGWMSNRGRQNVASFFAKEKELDWRIGASYFESLLVDYDVHSNYGNWMYVAGVGNDPRDRKFNIQKQAERYDRNQSYQKLWLNELIPSI